MQYRKLMLPLLAGLLLVGQATQAQSRRQGRYRNGEGRVYYRGPLRATLGGGTAFYNGDLGGPGQSFLGPAAELGVLYRIRPRVLLGGGFTYATLGATDQSKERGLAFTGQNLAGTAFVRFDLLPDESAFSSVYSDTPPFQVFVQAGIGALLYDPRSYMGTGRPGDGTIYLKPERSDYPAMAGVLPAGAGLSIRLNDQLRVNLEGHYFFTTTDNLDDISNERLGGASRGDDGFGVLLLKADYTIPF
jgi:hypothetical protein